MKDDGQMILLSALVACIFLVLIALCLNSVRESAVLTQSAGLTRDEVDNVLWAQEACLRGSAATITGYSWDRRYEAANAFRAAAAPALAGMEKNLQRRGIAYTFTYSDTVARPYVTGIVPGDMECIGGIIVSRDGINVKIIGCGYDVLLFDGSARFEAARLVTW